eukprot:m.61737 g.61737  ORF g.61737 m.61737 type:complete len:430 (+) comp15771_c0_seq1:341-1630(+)
MADTQHVPPLESLRFDLFVIVVLSFFAFVATFYLIPWFSPLFINAGLSGKDIGKVEKNVVAESQGTMASAVYLITMFLFIPFHFHPYLLNSKETDFPHGRFVEFICALLSICCMIFLGFADDVLNLKWRHKLLLPTVASLPLLMVYLVNFGSTTIVVPEPLRSVFGVTLDLGFLYYVYMGMLAVFCTNAVNILAGINGVEAGQSFVIGVSIVVHNAMQIHRGALDHQNHELSLFLLLPFLGVTSALLYHNWYPSSCFVGDTFCYFSGMTFAVAGILGHFSKTMILFFIPQVLNFIFSVPQLFRLVPCPRHRLPRLNPETGLLENSTATFRPCDISQLSMMILTVYKSLGVISYRKFEDKDGQTQIEVSNFTLINLLLRAFGPTHERTLTILVLVCQALCSLLAFYLRYVIVLYLYEGENDYNKHMAGLQ